MSETPWISVRTISDAPAGPWLCVGDTPLASMGSLLATSFQLTVILGICLYANRRSGKSEFSLVRTCVATGVMLGFCVPSWWLFSRFVLTNEGRWQESWVACNLLFGPILILAIWGNWYFWRGGPHNHPFKDPAKPAEPTGPNPSPPDAP